MATATEETIPNGGLKIFVRSWRPDGKPRGVVVICHGLNAHSGQYAWAAAQLAAGGLAVYAADLRGRGKSEGERFYVEDMAEWVSDLSVAVKLAKSREPGLPVFMLGHSAGGVVACTYTVSNQKELAGFICEDFAFQVPAPGFAIAAIKGLSHIAPRLGVLTLKNENFSRDPKAVAAMNNDPLIAHETQPAITIAALARADEALHRDFPKITIPVFIIHGTEDKVTLPAGSQFFYDTVGSKDKTLELYEGHFHDLLADTGKERVIAEIKAWIDKRLAPAA
jgi:alpha-beta hydrolase superfamily lysophospholipase